MTQGYLIREQIKLNFKYMKHITLLLVAIFLSVAGFAQSHSNHDGEMERFKKFYNNKMDDSIAAMFSDNWRSVPKDQLWPKNECAGLQKKYGTIKSFAYIGEMDDDPSVKLYKVITTKKTYATGISLDDKNKMETFRFDTTSPHIKELMKKHKPAKS
jgi:hypothetical protein